MEVTVTKTFQNGVSLQIRFNEGDDLREALIRATPFINLDTECGCCGSNDLSIQARITKEGFHYVEQICKQCWARRAFGEYKEPKGAFFIKGEWAKYQKPAEKDER
jgi:hypothetical protein